MACRCRPLSVRSGFAAPTAADTRPPAPPAWPPRPARATWSVLRNGDSVEGILTAPRPRAAQLDVNGKDLTVSALAGGPRPQHRADGEAAAEGASDRGSSSARRRPPGPCLRRLHRRQDSQRRDPVQSAVSFPVAERRGPRYPGRPGRLPLGTDRARLRAHPLPGTTWPYVLDGSVDRPRPAPGRQHLRSRPRHAHRQPARATTWPAAIVASKRWSVSTTSPARGAPRSPRPGGRQAGPRDRRSGRHHA